MNLSLVSLEPYLVRRRLTLALLERQIHLQLHRQIEHQRQQRHLDVLLTHYFGPQRQDESKSAASRSPDSRPRHDKPNDFVPLLPDGNLDMMYGIRLEQEELNKKSHTTPGQGDIQRRGSVEHASPARGPQDGPARGPRASDNWPLAPGVYANLHLAHGDTSHSYHDDHAEGSVNNLNNWPLAGSMNANLYLAHGDTSHIHPDPDARSKRSAPDVDANPSPAPKAPRRRNPNLPRLP